MKIKRILLIIAVMFCLGVFIVFHSLRNTSDAQLDIIKVNDIINNLSANWEYIKNEANISFGYELDYIVIGNDGKLIAATRGGLNENINEAVRNRDTVVDITVNNVIVGKAVFYNDTALIWEQYRERLIIGSICILVFVAVICTGYVFYLYHTVLSPFAKLRYFARRIADGNLDIPLEMDRNNLFGAFTESFDLMRTELYKARENERNANQSKKELVASLSHDIKTPVASIKAVSELMLIKVKDKKEKKQLETIGAKAEQINSLITNMFHATLEELQALNVTVAEIHSSVIHDLIQSADYEKRVKSFSVPDCILLADTLRLQQVIDNIIGNSYKYAGTDIEIQAVCDKRFLVIHIMDFGAGVSEEDLPLLFNKFFRGKNADTKHGYGLGLYISKYLIEQMNGVLQCENHANGFSVRLMLRLAG